MATNKRTYPNTYFAWYNDDNRVGILTQDTTATSGERTKEKYDTFQGSGDLSATITGVTRSSSTATYTTSAAHSFSVGDRVSISGTTAYNDADLASQSITSSVGSLFSMTLKSSLGSTESGLTASATSLFVNNALRITYHSKYETIDAQDDDLKTDAGLDSGMHPYVVCYLKARMFEDIGDLQQAQYFRQMYDKMVKQYPLRKTGIRQLAVPRL